MVYLYTVTHSRKSTTRTLSCTVHGWRGAIEDIWPRQRPSHPVLLLLPYINWHFNDKIIDGWGLFHYHVSLPDGNIMHPTCIFESLHCRCHIGREVPCHVRNRPGWKARSLGQTPGMNDTHRDNFFRSITSMMYAFYASSSLGTKLNLTFTSNLSSCIGIVGVQSSQTQLNLNLSLSLPLSLPISMAISAKAEASS